MTESRMDDALERLLEQVARGELAPDAVPVRSARERSAEFARELDALRTTQAAADAAAGEERAVLDAAATLEDAPGEERVDATLRALAGRLPVATSGGPRPITRRAAHAPRPSLLLWAVGAALAVALLWALRDPGTTSVDDTDRPPTALGRGLEVEAPRGDVERVDAFRWSDRRAGTGDYYRVRIFAIDAPDTPLWTEARIETTNWTPSAEARATFPARGFVWELSVWSIDGGPRGGAAVRTEVRLP